MQAPLQIEAKARADEKAHPRSRIDPTKTILLRRAASAFSTQELGAKLRPELREWVDRVIVPALLREYTAEKRTGNCLAKSAEAVRQFEPDALSCEERR